MIKIYRTEDSASQVGSHAHRYFGPAAALETEDVINEKRRG